jgi:hypothetical protein
VVVLGFGVCCCAKVGGRHPRGELVRFYSVESIEKIKRRVIKLRFLTCDQKLCLSLFELGQGVSTRVSVFVMEAIDVRAS